MYLNIINVIYIDIWYINILIIYVIYYIKIYINIVFHNKYVLLCYIC